jgi:choline dehydrogenase-like flavoprotein
VVAGGGFAGLAAATSLAERGARVLLCEARPHLGGRARSWTDAETGSVIDNGQHLFSGSYAATLRFLDRIGTRGRLRIQERLAVPLAEPGGRVATFGAGWGSGRLGALTALLRAPGLTRGDRLRLVRVALAARRPAPSLDAITVRDWLTSLGQSEEVLRRLWEPLATAALTRGAAPAGTERHGVPAAGERGAPAGGAHAARSPLPRGRLDGDRAPGDHRGGGRLGAHRGRPGGFGTSGGAGAFQRGVQSGAPFADAHGNSGGSLARRLFKVISSHKPLYLNV